MKITKSYLRQVIKEEIEALNENENAKKIIGDQMGRAFYYRGRVPDTNLIISAFNFARNNKLADYAVELYKHFFERNAEDDEGLNPGGLHKPVAGHVEAMNKHKQDITTTFGQFGKKHNLAALFSRYNQY